jgi:hypothetical protein
VEFGTWVKNTMKQIILLSILFQCGIASATSYECKVTRKVGPENIVSESELKKWQFSIKIHDNAKPELERCSFAPSQNKVTCDKYTVDKVEVDKFIGVKKFYYFRGQFDVQLYQDMAFVENNGRSSISFGKCKTL